MDHITQILTMAKIHGKAKVLKALDRMARRYEQETCPNCGRPMSYRNAHPFCRCFPAVMVEWDKRPHTAPGGGCA